MRNENFVIGWISLALVFVISPALPLRADDTVQDVSVESTIQQGVNEPSSLPHKAVVLEDNAPVWSGPAADFYETDRLAKGTQVEVHRVEADGWLAIRPPADSFSWIAAEHVEITSSGTRARVINLPAKTRVGSRFDDSHDVEYISLHEGEILDLIGTKMLQDTDDTALTRWFKIAPPAGEFRWIHSRDVARIENSTKVADTIVGREPIKTYSLDSDPKTRGVSVANNSAPVRTVVSSTNQASSIQTRSIRKATARNAENSGFREISDATTSTGTVIKQVAYVEPKPKKQAARRRVASSLQSSSVKKSVASTHINPVTWEAVGAPTNPLAAPEPRSFQDSYNALNIVLSRAVLGDIDTWKLDKVAHQAELLHASAANQNESALATSLIAKTKEFQQLQRRKLETNAEPLVALASYKAADLQKPGRREAAPRLAEPNLLPASMLAADRMPKGPEMPQRLAVVKPIPNKQTKLVPKESVDNSIFDATGTLIAVVSRRKGMPRYALTDSSGQITRFVSASDGSSLDQFVNSRVGVLGEIGLLRELNKSHVVAIKTVKLKR